MKKCIAMLIPLLVLASLFLSAYAMDGNGAKQPSNSSVILKNEVLLNRDASNYTELRHIVLKGTNEQIGEALGEIAKEDYNVSLYPYADPIYAEARLDYMQKNYPAFYERMKGVAAAYNVPLNSNLDLGRLAYDAEYPDCAMVYFPSPVTSNGRVMICRDIDFYKAPYDILYGKTKNSSKPDILQRAFVLETYPDKGYSSLILGSVDLMGAILHGFNSQGLGFDMQVDDFGPANPNASLVGSRNNGISTFDIGRLILDNCKSIDEAKIALLNNKIYFFRTSLHFMIYDKYGHATIAEFQGPLDPIKDGSIHFTDYSNNTTVMTNHAVYLIPGMMSVEEYLKKNPNATDCYYDTFARYKTLSDIISNHKGKFTRQDMLDTLSSVYEEVTGGNMTGSAAGVAIKSRTLVNYLLDLTNGTLSVRFYLKDGWTPEPGENTGFYCPKELHPIIFSKFFNFTLEK